MNKSERDGGLGRYGESDTMLFIVGKERPALGGLLITVHHYLFYTAFTLKESKRSVYFLLFNNNLARSTCNLGRRKICVYIYTYKEYNYIAV